MDWSVYIKCVIIVSFFFPFIRIRNNIPLEFAYVLFFKGVFIQFVLWIKRKRERKKKNSRALFHVLLYACFHFYSWSRENSLVFSFQSFFHSSWNCPYLVVLCKRVSYTQCLLFISLFFLANVLVTHNEAPKTMA